ncbi:MAG: alkaline phosphatase D family protein [Burkholderiaceae bacterium]
MHEGNPKRRLSENATALLTDPAIEADEQGFDCDVLIVGSGYGGAVAAARLAGLVHGGPNDEERRPLRLFVLERGEEYLPGMFPSSWSELPGHVRFAADGARPARGVATGLFDMRLGEDVNVLVANGLGGGSLINAAVMERPTSDAFASGWPQALATHRAALDAAFGRAEDMIDGWHIDDRLPADRQRLPRKTNRMLDLADRLPAFDARTVRMAISANEGSSNGSLPLAACTLCGDCVSGCNVGAKRSLDTNYLHVAWRNGARLFCGATVHRLQRDAGGWCVEWFLSDPGVSSPDKALYRLRSRCVVLSAGVLGSTEILLRSQEGGLPVSRQLGRRFSSNGDAIAAAYGAHQPADCRRPGGIGEDPQIGPTITAMARVPVDGARPVTIQEFSIPQALARVLDEVVTTYGALDGLLSGDWRAAGARRRADPMAIDERRMRHTMVYGMMGDDGAAGVIEPCIPAAGYESARFDGQVRIRWAALRDAPVFQAQMEILRRAHEDKGLGGRILGNPLWEPVPRRLGLSASRGPAVSVHPLGGCAIGETAIDGVVDLFGRVFDARVGGFMTGLAVLDGSIVPVSLGINPALTIAALAEMAVPQLIRDWNLQAPQSRLARGVLPAPRLFAAVRSEPVRTTARIEETSTGTLTVEETAYRAALKIRFRSIDDLVGFTRQTPRSLVCEQVGLTLIAKEEPAVRWELMLDGEAALLDEQRSTVFSRVFRGYRLALDRIRSFGVVGEGLMAGAIVRLMALKLASHVGGIREMRYRFKVTDVRRWSADATPPSELAQRAAVIGLRCGDRLEWVKTLSFDDEANPWLQLSSGELFHVGPGPEPTRARLGRLTLDLDEMANSLRPLLSLERQADQPAALADLASLGLFVLRASLQIHALNLLWPNEPLDRQPERFPGEIDGLRPDVEFRRVAGSVHRLRLSRYRRAPVDCSRNVVLMIHGIGASGSTFAHPSIPGNGVRTMLDQGREVWVLDLRTSIALEQREPWSFETVATEDIPAAVERIAEVLDDEGAPRKIDVIAHCIGAAMFYMALMDDGQAREPADDPADGSPHWSTHIGAVVLSQVAPLVRLSPYNRFRGFVANYLKQYLDVRTLDVLAPDGTMQGSLVDALLATFPYDDGIDGARPDAAVPGIAESERQRRRRIGAFSRARHRADGIFGQLMNLPNMADQTLEHLTAIYGWVRVEVIAQVIQFARHNLVTDASGRNAWLDREKLLARFDRPVLFVHGERNAVFDWRGAVDSVLLLRSVFRDRPWPVSILGAGLLGPASRLGAAAPRPGRMSRRELRQFGLTRTPWGWRASAGRFHAAILAGYGHQDCMIGRNVGPEVFTMIGDFFDGSIDGRRLPAASATRRPPKTMSCGVDVPAVGPILGAVGREPSGELSLRLLVGPRAERTNCLGICVIPRLADAAGNPADDYDDARLRVIGVSPSSDHDNLFVFRIAEDELSAHRHWLVLTLHEDFPGRIAGRDRMARDSAVSTATLALKSTGGGTTLEEEARQGFREALRQGRLAEFLSSGHLDVSPDWVRAASNDDAVADQLCFLAGSCHYPAGLFDREVAQASYRRMHTRIASSDGHSPQFLVLTGDQVYVDEYAGVFDPADYGDRYTGVYERTFQLPVVRAVMRGVPVYPMLDDHEVANDWERGRMPATDVLPALATYEKWQHALVSDRGRDPCYSYRFSPAGFPFFVLDTRTARTGRALARKQPPLIALPPPGEARLVHADTLERLLTWLEAGPDVPKFIVTPAVVFPVQVRTQADDPGEWLTLDDWGGYPSTLFTVLDRIRERAIRNVVFISGDLHLSLVSRLSMRAADGTEVLVHSIVSSGLHSPWPFANTRPEDLITEGRFSLRVPGAERSEWPSLTVTTPLSSARQGFACIGVGRDGAGRWRLDVEFDHEDGVHRWGGCLS